MLEKKDLEMIREIVTEVVDTRIERSEEKMSARFERLEEKIILFRMIVELEKRMNELEKTG